MAHSKAVTMSGFQSEKKPVPEFLWQWGSWPPFSSITFIWCTQPSTSAMWLCPSSLRPAYCLSCTLKCPHHMSNKHHEPSLTEHLLVWGGVSGRMCCNSLLYRCEAGRISSCALSSCATLRFPDVCDMPRHVDWGLVFPSLVLKLMLGEECGSSACVEAPSHSWGSISSGKITSNIPVSRWPSNRYVPAQHFKGFWYMKLMKVWSQLKPSCRSLTKGHLSRETFSSCPFLK